MDDVAVSVRSIHFIPQLAQLRLKILREHMKNETKHSKKVVSLSRGVVGERTPIHPEGGPSGDGDTIEQERISNDNGGSAQQNSLSDVADPNMKDVGAQLRNSRGDDAGNASSAASGISDRGGAGANGKMCIPDGVDGSDKLPENGTVVSLATRDALERSVTIGRNMVTVGLRTYARVVSIDLETRTGVVTDPFASADCCVLLPVDISLLRRFPLLVGQVYQLFGDFNIYKDIATDPVSVLGSSRDVNGYSRHSIVGHGAGDRLQGETKDTVGSDVSGNEKGSVVRERDVDNGNTVDPVRRIAQRHLKRLDDMGHSQDWQVLRAILLVYRCAAYPITKLYGMTALLRRTSTDNILPSDHSPLYIASQSVAIESLGDLGGSSDASVPPSHTTDSDSLIRDSKQSGIPVASPDQDKSFEGDICGTVGHPSADTQEPHDGTVGAACANPEEGTSVNGKSSDSTANFTTHASPTHPRCSQLAGVQSTTGSVKSGINPGARGALNRESHGVAAGSNVVEWEAYKHLVAIRQKFCRDWVYQQ